MHTIIQGKRYNTETATLVGSTSNGNRGDHGYYNESLYITRNGSWFLAGYGGPASKYAVSMGNRSYSSGEGIKVLSTDDAQQWLEDNGNTDALEQYFTIADA